MGIAVYFVDALLTSALPGAGFKIQALRLFSDIAFGGAVYFITAFLLKAEELKLGWNLIKDRLKRGGADSMPS